MGSETLRWSWGVALIDTLSFRSGVIGEAVPSIYSHMTYTSTLSSTRLRLLVLNNMVL